MVLWLCLFQEDVVAAHNKHCRDQANSHLFITDPTPLSPGNQVDFSNEDEGTYAPALQWSDSKQASSAAVQGPSLTCPSAPTPLEVLQLNPGMI